MRSGFLAATAPIAVAFVIVPLSGATRPAPVPGGTLAADTRYVIMADGSEARFRVREQLARIDFPSDAIGKTNKVEGQIVFSDKGAIVKDQSKFTVDVTNLVSDSDRRDNFVRRQTLQTAQFPTVTFVPAEAKGLKFPLPASGEVTFQLVGDLTVRDQTRPVTWDVKATVGGGMIMGQANTKFTFADFAMTKPKVASVLSVDDDIKLELDFHMMPAK